MSNAVREFGSEFDRDANLPFLTCHPSSFFFLGEGERYFRSGRDALKAVARFFGQTHRRVLLPALCCESMMLPFLQNGYEVCYYPLQEDLTASESTVAGMLEGTDVLLSMSYFGIPAFSDAALERLRRSAPSALFVEDRTHDLLCQCRKTAFEPDVTVASLRKWLSLEEGGLLWSRHPILDSFASDTEFCSLRREAMAKKSHYLKNGCEAEKKEFRSLLGKAAARLDADAIPYGMTEQTRREMIRWDYHELFCRRIRNAEHLFAELEPLRHAGLLTPIGDPSVGALYAPVLVEQRDLLQQHLARRGIYCPVIWPLPEGAEGISAAADHVSSHLLALPCDQRYDETDMSFVAAGVFEELTALVRKGAI